MMSGMSLRQELGVGKDPEFDLELPPGWGRHDVTARERDSTLKNLRLRLKQAGALDQYAEFEAAYLAALDEMEAAGVFAYFSASTPGEKTLAIPASINATFRSGPSGATLDEIVRGLIRSYGAEPLWGDPRIMVCEREKNHAVGGQLLVAHSRIYLTPVPGSRRRRALQLVANFPRAQDVPSDSYEIRTLRSMFDACVASLRWRREPVSSRTKG